MGYGVVFTCFSCTCTSALGRQSTIQRARFSLTHASARGGMRALRAPALRALPRGARSRARGCARCARSRAALTPACTFAPTSYIWLTHASARAGMRALRTFPRKGMRALPRCAHTRSSACTCVPTRILKELNSDCLFAGPLGSIMTRHDRPFGPLWRARVIRFAICIIVTTIFRAIGGGQEQS